jgi:hypothetical protein
LGVSERAELMGTGVEEVVEEEVVGILGVAGAFTAGLGEEGVDGAALAFNVEEEVRAGEAGAFFVAGGVEGVEVEEGVVVAVVGFGTAAGFAVVDLAVAGFAVVVAAGFAVTGLAVAGFTAALAGAFCFGLSSGNLGYLRRWLTFHFWCYQFRSCWLGCCRFHCR